MSLKLLKFEAKHFSKWSYFDRNSLYLRETEVTLAMRFYKNAMNSVFTICFDLSRLKSAPSQNIRWAMESDHSSEMRHWCNRSCDMNGRVNKFKSVHICTPSALSVETKITRFTEYIFEIHYILQLSALCNNSKH